MNKPIRAVLVGAGQRGANAYGPYALRNPEQLQFTAVAEPDETRRRSFSAQHHIPPQYQFENWQQLFEHPALGETAFVCTQDWQHTEPTLLALDKGYHVLLEKPMATRLDECDQLLQSSYKQGLQLHICHVLRYTKHFKKMRQVIESGDLGSIINVNHSENVSFWHMAHSYVRGNWRDSTQSSPMILAKCCHDFDILLWLLGTTCESLSSTGSLTHFRPENAPEGAPPRCLDGCPVQQICPYNAAHIYLSLAPLWESVAQTSSGLTRVLAQTQKKAPGLIRLLSFFAPPLRQFSPYRGWPLPVLAEDPSPENLLNALREGPYGKCVYFCDNNVVDHQVVCMQFANQTTATLTMQGHSHIEHRSTRIDGSKGTLEAEFGVAGSWLRVHDHRSGTSKQTNTSGEPGSGHGGGDFELVAAFLDRLHKQDTEQSYQALQAAYQSHQLAFAAEESRLQHTTKQF